MEGGSRIEPWEAHYDQYGRQIGRTDYNAGNPVENIPPIHFHAYKFGPGYADTGFEFKTCSGRIYIMKKICNDINMLHSLHIRKYTFVRFITITQSYSVRDCCIVAKLTLSLSQIRDWDNEDFDGDIIDLEFDNIHDLHFNPKRALILLNDLEIYDVKENQLEGFNYMVVDEEDSVLSFYCKSFSIILAD